MLKCKKTNRLTVVVVKYGQNRLVVDLLFVGLLVVPFFQPNTVRLVLAICYVMPILTHDWLFGAADGHTYFITDVVGCLISAELIRRVVDSGRIAVTLLGLCLASAVGNLLGWVAWYLYLPSLAYEAFYLLLYGYALWTLTTGTGANVAIHRDHWLNRDVRFGRA